MTFIIPPYRGNSPGLENWLLCASTITNVQKQQKVELKKRHQKEFEKKSHE